MKGFCIKRPDMSVEESKKVLDEIRSREFGKTVKDKIGGTTMKAYTDIEQSKKLAEILPIESADMFWYRDAVTKEVNPRIMNYIQVPELQSMYYSPCWSLAALLNALPYPSLHKTCIGWRCDSYNKEGTSCILGEPLDNPIDACYEMILTLHKLKML